MKEISQFRKWEMWLVSYIEGRGLLLAFAVHHLNISLDIYAIYVVLLILYKLYNTVKNVKLHFKMRPIIIVYKKYSF